MIYASIISALGHRKLVAILVDPDKLQGRAIEETGALCDEADVDFLLVGGSLVSGSLDETVLLLKSHTSKPVILFPGSVLQISPHADAILLLSLISGRNPEYLIGNHVIAAPVLKKNSLEVIPTGYILVENGRTTSVEYVSNTKPIPADKVDLAVATALAGEMLGHRLIYLEAGSGASNAVNENLISAVSRNINIPLIVGGGIGSAAQISQIFEAGADIIVIGSAIEADPDNLSTLIRGVSRSR